MLLYWKSVMHSEMRLSLALRSRYATVRGIGVIKKKANCCWSNLNIKSYTSLTISLCINFSISIALFYKLCTQFYKCFILLIRKLKNKRWYVYILHIPLYSHQFNCIFILLCVAWNARWSRASVLLSRICRGRGSVWPPPKPPYHTSLTYAPRALWASRPPVAWNMHVPGERS